MASGRFIIYFLNVYVFFVHPFLRLTRCTYSSTLADQLLTRKDILIDDVPTNNKLEGCPIVTKNIGDSSLQILAECDEGASLAQYIVENSPSKVSTKQSIPSITSLKLGKLTKGLLDEENVNFKSLLMSNKMIKISGTVLNTIHFADGNLAVSDIKINSLEFQKSTTEFADIKLSLQGIVEINGDQIPISLEKKAGKSVLDVKVTNVQSVTIEELVTTFKTSVENIVTMKFNNQFKTNELKAVSLTNPTIIGKLTIDGSLQLVANSEASDDNLYFAHENLFVVINKKRTENPKLAIVFNIGKGKSIDDLFSSIMKNQSKSFSCPIIGKFSSNDWALSFSEGNNIAVAAPEQMLLPYGINARIELSKTEIDKVCKDLLIEYSNAAFEIQLNHNGKYFLKPAATFHPNIDKFLECLLPESKQVITLPEELTEKCNFNKLNITKLFFDPHVGGYDLKFIVSCDQSIFSGVVQFSDFFVHIKKTINSWVVNAVSHSSLPNLEKRSDSILHDSTISLEYLTSSFTNETSVEADFPDLSLGNILTTMNIDKDSFHLTNSFSDMFDINLMDIEFSQLSNPIRFSANSFWYGYSVRVSAVSWFDDASTNTEKEKTKDPVKEIKSSEKSDTKKPNSQDESSKKENKLPNNSSASHQGKKKEFKKVDEIKQPKQNGESKIKIGEDKVINNKDKRQHENHHLFRPSFYNNSMLKNDTESEFKNTEESSGDNDYIQDTQSSGFFNLGETLNKVVNSKIETFKPKTSSLKINSLPPLQSLNDANEVSDGASKGDSNAGISSDQINDITGDSRSFKKLYTSLNMKREKQNMKQFNKGASLIRLRANVPQVNFDPLLSNNFLQSVDFDRYFGRFNNFYPYPDLYSPERFSRDSITSPGKTQTLSTVIKLSLRDSKLADVLYYFYNKRIITNTWISDTSIDLIISNSDTGLPEKYRQKNKGSENIKKSDVDESFDKHSSLFSKLFNNQKTCHSSIDRLFDEALQGNSKCESKDIDVDDIFWTQLKRGFSLSSTFSSPASCKKNRLCEWVKQRVEDETEINLFGFLTSTHATIYGQLPLIQDASTDDFVFDKAILLLTYNENDLESSGLRIKVDITVKRPISIPLIGFIYEAASGSLLARLQPQKSKSHVPFLKMINPWYRDLFTNEIIAYCSIDPQLKIFPSIDLVSYIRLGKARDETSSDDHLITFKAIFTFSASDPTQYYLSGDISDLSMVSLATALGYENNLPKYMKNAIFPNGATFSYSSNQSLGNFENTAETQTPSGYQITGDLRIFEFFVPVEILLLSAKMEILIHLPRFEVMDGMVLFGYSGSNSMSGPILKCIIGLEESSAEIDSEVHTMGANSIVNIKLIQETLQFNLSAMIFDTLLMDISFKGKLYGQLMKIEFQVNGCVQKKDITLMEKKLIKMLEKESSTAVLYKQKSDNIFKLVEQSLINARRQINDWKVRLQEYNNKIKEKTEELKKTKSELKKSCVNECSDVCVPFFRWDHECFEIWGNLVGCPGWDNCRWKVKDVVCLATCELEKISKKLVTWSDSLGIRAVLGLSEMGSEIISNIEGFFRNYKTLYEHVKKTHENIVKKTSLAFQIKETLETTESPISINSLCGNALMNKDWSPSMDFEFDGRICNQSVKWKEKFNFDMKLPGRIIEKSINTRFSLSSISDVTLDDASRSFILHVKEQQQVLENMKNELQISVDNFVSGKSLLKKQNDGRSLRSGFVSQRDSWYRENSPDEFLQYDVKNSETMKAYFSASPWNLVENFKYDMTNIPLYVGATEDTSPVQRSIDTCSQMRHVVEKYDKLTQGMKRFAASTERQRVNYVATKKAYLNELEKMSKKMASVENLHSFSVTDIEDLRYWHDSVRDGLEKWNTMSEAIYLDGQRRGLAAFKNQMDYILKREKESNVREYVAQLHDKGMDAYKRSNFPNYSSIKGGIFLGEIKKAILDLYNDVDSPLQEFTEKILKTEQKIDQLKHYMKSCNLRK